MIRTLSTIAAATLAAVVLLGCDGGVDRSDAPKSGQQRPKPTETIKPSGPGGAGATQSGTQQPPPTTEEDE